MSRSNLNTVERLYRERYFKNISKIPDKDIQYRYLIKTAHGNRQYKSVILDAGCGNGRYAQSLVNQGYKNVYAVDLFEKIPQKGNVIYKQASIDKLPFPSDFFDFVYSFSVIFYLDHPEEAIKEFKRVLKPGSTLLITAHTKYSLFTLWRLVKRMAGLKSVEHLNGIVFYSAKQYENMLTSNGFSITQVDGYDISFFIYPVYRKFSKLVKICFGIKLPKYYPKLNHSPLVSRFRAVFGYHSVLIAQKI